MPPTPAFCFGDHPLYFFPVELTWIVRTVSLRFTVHCCAGGSTLKLIEAPNKAIASARQPNNENSPELADKMAKLAKRKD